MDTFAHYYTAVSYTHLADIKVEKKVLKTLKVTDNHKFTIQTAAEDTTDETAEVTETPEVTEEADATETSEVTEEADAT